MMSTTGPRAKHSYLTENETFTEAEVLALADYRAKARPEHSMDVLDLVCGTCPTIDFMWVFKANENTQAGIARRYI